MQNEPTDAGKIDAARVEESNEIDAEWDGGRSKHDAERADGFSTVVRSTMRSAYARVESTKRRRAREEKAIDSKR